MRTLSLCLILACVILAAKATETTELSSLESSPYGQQILDMMQLQFTTNSQNPVETITKALLDMRRQIVEDQVKEDQLHQKELEDCISSKRQLRTEIRKYRVKLARAKTTRLEVIKEINNIKREQKQNERVQRTITEYIEKLRKQRAEEKKRYEEEIADISKQREALQKARAIINQLSAPKGASFLEEKTSALAQIQATFRDNGVRSKYLNSLGDIALFFAQLGEKADPSVVEGILGLFDELIASLNENEYVATKIDTERDQSHEKAVNEQKILLQTEATRAASLASKLANEESRRRQLLNDINEFDRAIRQKRNELKNRREQCQAELNAYFKRKNERVEELKIIDLVIDFLNERLDNVKEYVQGRKLNKNEDEAAAL
eukprot:TRINITY_DN7516_c0_g1_i1.p1 TRINITY_DN7516_c0_g1~~TRINITY_DN7516_c0_g1_i1.p1  ORF type:complete len:378 (+),score=161.17 TRINITY_DN7516_c0_g1_i1:49-1182(+)